MSYSIFDVCKAIQIVLLANIQKLIDIEFMLEVVVAFSDKLKFFQEYKIERFNGFQKFKFFYFEFLTKKFIERFKIQKTVKSLFFNH